MTKNILFQFVVGELLELANREFRTQEYYKLKDRILKELGEKVGYDTQHIVKVCRTCGGSGKTPFRVRLFGETWTTNGEKCYHCYGSGKHDEFWVLLEVHKVGRRRFHLPTGRQWSHEVFEKFIKALEITPQAHFEGLITHTPPRFHLGREAGWWLILLFDPASLREYFFGRVHQYGFIFTPLLLLNNLLYFLDCKYHAIKNSLSQFRRRHCKHVFAWTDDPWGSDECRKCGVERWEIEKDKPVF